VISTVSKKSVAFMPQILDLEMNNC
jgi:hypothetical protein